MKYLNYNKLNTLLILVFLLCLSSCKNVNKQEILRIACSPVPHADILETAQKELLKHNIDLRIVCIEDYGIPNKLLAEHQVDANFFQHIAYLNEEIKNNKYAFSILLLFHFEPLGVYSQKIKSLSELETTCSKSVLTIAVPNDPSNEQRALNLLIKAGILSLRQSAKNDILMTAADVQGCSRKVKIIETDAAILPRCLADVDLAVIPANFVLLSDLDSEKDALIVEKADSSEYVNVIVVRTEDLEKPVIVKFKKIMNSPEIREEFINLYKTKGLKFC